MAHVVDKNHATTADIVQGITRKNLDNDNTPTEPFCTVINHLKKLSPEFTKNVKNSAITANSKSDNTQHTPPATRQSLAAASLLKNNSGLLLIGPDFEFLRELVK